VKKVIMTVELHVQVPDDTEVSGLCLGNTNTDFRVEHVTKEEGELGAVVTEYGIIDAREDT